MVHIMSMFKPIGSIQLKPFADKDGLNVKFDYFTSTISANTSKVIQYTIPEKSKINGFELILKNQNWDDYAEVLVRDDSNGTYSGTPNSILLDIGKITFRTDVEGSGPIISPYDMELQSGMIIEVKYHNTGLINPVKLKINLFKHKVI